MQYKENKISFQIKKRTTAKQREKENQKHKKKYISAKQKRDIDARRMASITKCFF